MLTVRFSEPEHDPSGKITVNVTNRGGHPLGQIWTYKVPGERHPWHSVGARHGIHETHGSIEAAKARFTG